MVIIRIGDWSWFLLGNVGIFNCLNILNCLFVLVMVLVSNCLLRVVMVILWLEYLFVVRILGVIWVKCGMCFGVIVNVFFYL